MSIAIALGLKLALPLLAGGLGGHMAGGILLSYLTKAGVPSVVAKELVNLAKKLLPELLELLQSPHIESLPPEERNAAQQKVAEINRVRNVLTPFCR